MRSLLFVPGNSTKMMAKAATCGADVIILDLEDAVHPDAKAAARQLVADTLVDNAGGTRRATSGSTRSTANGARGISKRCFRRAPTASCCQKRWGRKTSIASLN